MTRGGEDEKRTIEESRKNAKHRTLTLAMAGSPAQAPAMKAEGRTAEALEEQR